MRSTRLVPTVQQNANGSFRFKAILPIVELMLSPLLSNTAIAILLPVDFSLEYVEPTNVFFILNYALYLYF